MARMPLRVTSLFWGGCDFVGGGWSGSVDVCVDGGRIDPPRRAFIFTRIQVIIQTHHSCSFLVAAKSPGRPGTRLRLLLRVFRSGGGVEMRAVPCVFHVDVAD